MHSELLPLEELYFQLAPIAEYPPVLQQLETWPTAAAQHAMALKLNPRNHRFLVHQPVEPNISFLPPLTYQKAIYRYLERSVGNDIFARFDSTGEIDFEEDLDDEFIEQCVQVINAVTNAKDHPLQFSEEIEPQHVGFASYPVPFAEDVDTEPNSSTHISTHSRVPILVKKSFHQVGTKVWGAGLFLAELFQYVSINDDLFRDKILFELGAGVGITGLLMSKGLPKHAQPRRIVMTDCFEEVLNMMKFNVSLLQGSELENKSTCELVVEHCDWSDDSEAIKAQLTRHFPDCLFAADCTYSEDLNLLLISLFELYLTLSIAATKHDSALLPTNDIDFIPSQLLKNGERFVLIACTIRHPDTFRHFETHLHASSLLDVCDISTMAHEIIQRPLYYYDFRENIRLFCITKKK
jgi:hypothetical protein